MHSYKHLRHKARVYSKWLIRYDAPSSQCDHDEYDFVHSTKVHPCVSRNHSRKPEKRLLLRKRKPPNRQAMHDEKYASVNAIVPCCQCGQNSCEYYDKCVDIVRTQRTHDNWRNIIWRYTLEYEKLSMEREWFFRMQCEWLWDGYDYSTHWRLMLPDKTLMTKDDILHGEEYEMLVRIYIDLFGCRDHWAHASPFNLSRDGLVMICNDREWHQRYESDMPSVKCNCLCFSAHHNPMVGQGLEDAHILVPPSKYCDQCTWAVHVWNMWRDEMANQSWNNRWFDENDFLINNDDLLPKHDDYEDPPSILLDKNKWLKQNRQRVRCKRRRKRRKNSM